MHTTMLGAIVVVVLTLAGCGGGGGGNYADICEPCTRYVDLCQADCECVRVVDLECVGPETDEERQIVRDCLANNCRTCDAGLDCGDFDVKRCAIDDVGPHCCDGDQMVACD